MAGTRRSDPAVETGQGAAESNVSASATPVAYSLGRTPAGEWFALGTIRSDTVRMVIGTGATEADAIDQLTGKLNHQPSLS